MNRPDAPDQLLEALRAALLRPDREQQQSLRSQLAELERQAADESRFRARLEPHLEAQMAYLQENFPALFGKSIATAIKVQVRDSQGEIIDALYPIIGKLIARYIKAEIERISRQIDQRLQDPFAFEAWKTRFRAWRKGVSPGSLMLRETDPPRLEALFITAQQSGLLIAHMSRGPLLHPDMVAGMLTAIKSFAEHAFQAAVQELQLLEYDSYKIRISNLRGYYFAAAISGMPDSEFLARLEAEIHQFCERHRIPVADELLESERAALSEILTAAFYEFEGGDQ